ncbi:MAG TPA: arsenosugar biosynthesis radical SAM protein ArsS [Denitromonas sp.]|uniref:arsenosugar biosynthesis radical SAM (seleno)protein ArsS n=1 Tax=Denitromonas sp. TaxID=2734609 RepID=UPI001D911EC4|nr:arsenosugar biosynthesis radical SAM protein ArsS [Rhodocyclaceae bacterium]MCP5220931.1 arsenosugar biosynthesis radical SAM protein ArsS [Zoogloeaceae bacterium]HPR07404.1 arsenosugar biosynthesis radical SAM protein ArsS [Denitromonas sp.]HQU89398.1 arsenosugar biosynthesis radical SAM protein ArsS [Denitromonas sp.]HQV15597.1 arsenosugar biosynthesis radical SAM protein ArsS [Denitromonas sp.]
MLATLPLLRKTAFPALTRGRIETLQINLGYRCNQQCLHCHVNAGPKRTEEMDSDTIDAILRFVDGNPDVRMLDLTGGAPELNPHFRRLVVSARARGLRVIDRCNLTILSEPGYETLAEFLAEQGVEVVASLPCYLEDNVNAQRGKGVFETSINGLKQLNALGYGQPDSALTLNLVYNPQGAVLPPPQAPLEAAYKTHLGEHFGIVFNQLFTLANMPIQRFGSTLLSKGQFNRYMDLLRSAHSDDNLPGVMCRTQISIDWQGNLYDCDFNQMLEMHTEGADGQRLNIHQVTAQQLNGGRIQVAGHCYGCTAGQGSSCGGALN